MISGGRSSRVRFVEVRPTTTRFTVARPAGAWRWQRLCEPDRPLPGTHQYRRASRIGHRDIAQPGVPIVVEDLQQLACRGEARRPAEITSDRRQQSLPLAACQLFRGADRPPMAGPSRPNQGGTEDQARRQEAPPGRLGTRPPQRHPTRTLFSIPIAPAQSIRLLPDRLRALRTDRWRSPHRFPCCDG